MTENPRNQTRRDNALRQAAECRRIAERWQMNDQPRFVSYGALYLDAASRWERVAALFDADDVANGKQALNETTEFVAAHPVLPQLI